MSLIRRILSPEYWMVAEPGPIGRLWIIYAALGFAFLAGAALAIRQIRSCQREGGRDAAPPGQPSARQIFGWFELSISLAGSLTVLGRFLGWPGWSARIWPSFLAVLALLGVLAYQTRTWSMRAWLSAQMRILALLPPEGILPGAGLGRPITDSTSVRRQARVRGMLFALGCCLHMAGVAFVFQVRFGLPWWLAPALLAVPMVRQLRQPLERRLPFLLALTPLLAGYLATLIWALYLWTGLTVVGWKGLSFPDPMTSLFYVDGILLASACYSCLCQLFAACSSPPDTGPHRCLRARLRGSKAWQWTVAALALAALAWAAAVYLSKRTHGATGSDPYAYAQMAVDLATRGTLLHRFSLFQEIAPLGIAWGPLLPSGYHLPVNTFGDSPSVWATGASVLLAGGYRLLGEVGLYVTTPIIALAALIATWFLVVEVLRNETRATRYLTAALTVALSATSPEHVDRVLVPMADAAAQLFTILTLFFCLRAMRVLQENPRRAVLHLVLCGLAFAWAYWVRHTQLVLFLPVAIGLWLASTRLKQGERSFKARMRFLHLRFGRLWPLLVFSASATLMAIPDAIYRWSIFGHLFATETTELPSMALRHVGPMAAQTLRDALVAGEWGYLFPFALAGCWLLARHTRRAFGVLGTAFAAVLLVHLTYRFLRLRDLISIFPLVNLALSHGAVSLIRSARARALQARNTRRLGPALLNAGAITWVVLALALARWTAIDDPLKPGWASFGYVRPEQRAAFDRLRELTPPGAVIGASQNSGAVAMYTGRDSVRPYESWSPGDWATFVETVWSRSRRVFLLDDGSLMRDFIRKQGTGFRLIPVEALAIPVFGAPARETGWLYELVRLE